MTVIILYPEAIIHARAATIQTMAVNWIITVWSANPLIFGIMGFETMKVSYKLSTITK